ncbi:MAG: glycosyltransferase family 4 protein, partial [Sedimentisphaerales bacterium]|nr:glycosyltransferase family 4 protein [Sedimentisphaerales bacterium]
MLSTAIIIERTSIRLGGAERSVSELAQELKTQGVEAHILAAAGKPSENVTILCSQQDTHRTSLKTFEAAIERHVSQHHYDMIHSTLPLGCADIYQPRGGSFKEAMLQNAASYSNPWVRLWKEKSHFLNFRRTAFLRAEARLCADNQQTIVAALSDYVKQQFLRHYHLLESRIAVVANGINPNRHADPQKSQAFRRGILDKIPNEIRDKAILLFFAATNFRLKGLREAIIALSKAIELCPQCPAIIVAAGSNKISAYQRLAGQYRVGDRIIFCGPQQETVTAMAACDAAILPSWYDPCSR